MHHWTNTAQAPSRLGERKDKALLYTMKQLDIPECGLSTIKAGIHDNKFMAMNMSQHGGHAGLWDFYPVMDMSYNKGGFDYTQTTVLADGVQARGKYIPVNCGDKMVHTVYWPNCGNLSVVHKKEKEYIVKREKEYVEDKVVVYKERSVIEYEKCHSVPIPSTVLLLVLGLVSITMIVKSRRN